MVDERRTGATTDRAEGLGRATLNAIRRSVGTRPRRWLVSITLLMGLAAAVTTAAAGDSADLTFATLSAPAQSLMSVAVPLIGILLVHDLWQAPGRVRFTPTLLAAILLAAAVGAAGVGVCAATLAIASSGTDPDRWHHAGTIAAGSILVQVVAQLVGTGLGLLTRSVVGAFLASIVLPLGLWAGLGSVDILRAA
jgi:hypothetical protein